MTPEKLVHMANQIGQFFASADPDRAPAAIADHLEKFWDPSMCRQLTDYIAAGGEGLRPEVRQAAALLAAG